MSTLESLNFDNQTLRSLPIDNSQDNSIRNVSNACFTLATSTPVEKPELVAYSVKAMSLLDLPDSELQRPAFIDYFSGNTLIPGSQQAAHCYCGHQYGVFSGQLGDGCVMYLGEVVNKNGERWELQLKGSGQTAFSRLGDGRKVLRSSIREFLCSEAMYHLGIPTTRAGACITSGTMINRDVFCDGNVKKEKATIVTRIAPTFLRFGSFEICLPKSSEYAKSGPSVGNLDILIQLLEFTIKTYFPEIQKQFADNTNMKYKQFFKEVLMRTAKLVANWQCVGFCHGMLNTDNMSILGLTIDYGPFCFLDYYDPDTVPNSTDFGCRCIPTRQPEICHWNLKKLAEALQPCLTSDTFESELNTFWDEYKKFYMNIMRRKFGLFKALDDDKNLFNGFLELLESCGGDLTNCFRSLSLLSLPGTPGHAISIGKLVENLVYNYSSSDRMKLRLKNSLDENQIDLLIALFESQPDVLKDIMKNKKILQEIREMTPGSKLKSDRIKSTKWVALYIKRLQVEVVGVKDIKALNKKRVDLMNSINPRFVLRNYLAQNAIQEAENGDYIEVRNLLKIIENPFSDEIQNSVKMSGFSLSNKPTTSKQTTPKYDDLPPDWANEIRVT